MVPAPPGPGGLEGRLQFFAGCGAGGAALGRWLRRSPEPPRAAVAGGLARALLDGIAVGRARCVAVVEHRGGTTSFPLALRDLGGPTVERPITGGAAVHGTAWYEIRGLLILAVIRAVLARHAAAPRTLAAVAGLWYGARRSLTVFAPAYDQRVGGLTGALWAALARLGLAVAAAARRAGRDQPAATAGAVR